MIMTKSSSILLRLEKGELVNYNGQEYVITKVIDLRRVLAKNVFGKTTEVLEIRYLTPWAIRCNVCHCLRKSRNQQPEFFFRA